MSEARTIAQNQHIDLTFEPKKADGSPAQIDHADHDPIWTVDSQTLTPGVNEIGVAKFGLANDGSACQVTARSAAGGSQTYVISISGDADLDVGEVTNVVGTLSLELTVLPDQAVSADIGVGQPTDNPPPQP